MDRRTRFDDLWQRIGAHTDPAPVFDDLLARYREPHRRYHTEEHLRFGLAQLDLIDAEADDPDAVECAFFLHDAIYDIGAQDNEARSADFAATTLRAANVDESFINEVAACILATAPGSRPSSANERVISDIDLAILGQPRDAFDEYERQVREEYAAVPDAAFWRARKHILQGFVDRESIYSTLTFRDRYETSARENLRWTLAQH
jgi:predicted metal-dependent HD superfamily phosphohydrolase